MNVRLPTLAVLLLASSPFAQELRRTGLLPVTSPVRRVRVTVDPSTGAAKRIPLSAGAGSPEVIFDNTCDSGYFFGTATPEKTGGTASEAFIDEGRLPDTNSPANSTCAAGIANVYNVQVYQIGYCTSIGAAPTAVIWCWIPTGAGVCANNFEGVLPPAIIPALALTVTGLPGSQAPGTQACYVTDIVLGDASFPLPGSPSSGSRFTWGYQMPLTTGSDGPMIAGNPTFGGCTPCVGTIFEGPPGQTTNPGTGLDTVDAVRIETFAGTGSGCFFFGGVPYLSFWLELQGKGLDTSLSTPFCDASDGALASCPCDPGRPDTGCDIAQGTGGILLSTLALDTSTATALLAATGYPAATLPPGVILVRGNNQEPSPVPFGDGLRCVGTTGFARLTATEANGGTSVHPLAHGAGSGTFYYQTWFRNSPVSYCVMTGPSAGAFNLSNGQALTW